MRKSFPSTFKLRGFLLYFGAFILLHSDAQAAGLSHCRELFSRAKPHISRAIKVESSLFSQRVKASKASSSRQKICNEPYSPAFRRGFAGSPFLLRKLTPATPYPYNYRLIYPLIAGAGIATCIASNSSECAGGSPGEVIEVEHRYSVSDKQNLEEFLKKQKFVSLKTQTDIYLDTPSADLYQKGVYVRLRNNRKLDVKFNEEDFLQNSRTEKRTHCSEYTFAIPLIEEDQERLNDLLTFLGLAKVERADLKDLMNRNNLIESVVIEKNRKTYKGGKFTLCWDDVRGLGDFLEIEFLASRKDNLDSINKEMKGYIPEEIGLQELSTGYVDLTWRQRDFKVYRSGKYPLKEDREQFAAEERARLSLKSQKGTEKE